MGDDRPITYIEDDGGSPVVIYRLPLLPKVVKLA